MSELSLWNGVSNKNKFSNPNLFLTQSENQPYKRIELKDVDPNQEYYMVAIVENTKTVKVQAVVSFYWTGPATAVPGDGLDSHGIGFGIGPLAPLTTTEVKLKTKFIPAETGILKHVALVAWLQFSFPNTNLPEKIPTTNGGHVDATNHVVAENSGIVS